MEKKTETGEYGGLYISLIAGSLGAAGDPPKL